MVIDIKKLDRAYDRYMGAVSNSKLSEDHKRTDLKHMRFWYPYYANVVSAILRKEKAKIERRTLTKINEQSQIDYEHISNLQILKDLNQAQKTLVNNLPKIPNDTTIPYRKSTKYLPERYMNTLIDHLRMHWEYLEKLAKK